MMKAKTVLFFGVFAALAVSIAVTVPYVIAWNGYNSQIREMNFVSMSGETYVQNMSKSPVNITLVASYPRVIVHTTYHVFKAQLIFLITLDSSITNFRINYDHIIEFRSLDWSYVYVGFPPHDFQNNFYKYSETGDIAPYFVNATAEMTSGKTASYPWSYFTGTVDAYPEVRLNGFITLNNDNKNSSSIGFFFDMKDYPISIYIFNYPFALWIAYGSSIFMVIVPLLVCHHLSQKHEK